MFPITCHSREDKTVEAMKSVVSKDQLEGVKTNSKGEGFYSNNHWCDNHGLYTGKALASIIKRGPYGGCALCV